MSTLTSTPVVPLPARAVFPTEPVFGLTVENYHDIIKAGILTTDDRVELLEGALICKMGQNPAHRTAVIKLQRAFSAVLSAGVFGQFRAPITLDSSEPEPDGAIIRGAVEQFAERNPGPSAVCLTIEVADSTLRQDRGVKCRIYAGAGIAVYWIVNLVDRVIEVYSGPSPADATYSGRHEFRSGDRVPLVIDGRHVGEIAVDDILPPVVVA